MSSARSTGGMAADATLRRAIAGRVLFVTLLGIFGFATVSVPYWNWYGFPTDFTLAEAIDHVVGWFLAGLVLAAIVRPITPKPRLETKPSWPSWLFTRTVSSARPSVGLAPRRRCGRERSSSLGKLAEDHGEESRRLRAVGHRQPPTSTCQRCLRASGSISRPENSSWPIARPSS